MTSSALSARTEVPGTDTGKWPKWPPGSRQDPCCRISVLLLQGIPMPVSKGCTLQVRHCAWRLRQSRVAAWWAGSEMIAHTRRASLVFEKLPRAIAVSWPSLTGCASACAELTLSVEGATASSLSLHQFQYWVRLKLLVTPESWLSAAGDELAAWSATARARALEWTLMT